MVQGAVSEVIEPSLKTVLKNLVELADEYAALPMLARTHGQPAIPTTLGKELIVFAQRITTQLKKIKNLKLQAKLNGAVGGYQAMQFACPETNWPKLSQSLIKSLGFEWLDITTQINPSDDLVDLFQIFHHLNSILIDLNQDIWRYISDNWLVQKGKNQDVGSSTMPQKINPIEFENSEGNLAMANGLFETFIREIPVSRLQRDLSDSTVRRNYGSAFGHCLIAYTSLIKGLAKLGVNQDNIKQDLNHNYAILTEAWQTLARKQGDDQAYEKAAKFAKNKIISKENWGKATRKISSKLAQLKPEDYLGLSVEFTQKNIADIKKFLKEAYA